MGLEILELVIDVEKAYGIAIPDKAMYTVVTLGDFHNLIDRLIKEQHSDLSESLSYGDQLWSEIAACATRIGYYAKPETVGRHTRFIEDLGYG
ncbi:MAG: acyl carrier protein [Planctomycetota bacterium]